MTKEEPPPGFIDRLRGQVCPFTAHKSTSRARIYSKNSINISKGDKERLKVLSRDIKLIDRDVYYESLDDNIDKAMWWNNSTALMVAVIEGHIELVCLLISIGADVDAENDIKNNALLIAAEQGNLEVAKILYDASKVKFEARNIYGQTALMLAIEADRVDIVKWIIDMDTESEELLKTNKYAKCPLIIACEFGKYEIAILIVRKLFGEEPHIDVEAINKVEVDRNKNTPLMFACGGSTKGHAEIALFLLRINGINVTKKNNYNKMALDWAAVSGNVQVVERLLLLMDERSVQSYYKCDRVQEIPPMEPVESSGKAISNTQGLSSANGCDKARPAESGFKDNDMSDVRVSERDLVDADVGSYAAVMKNALGIMSANDHEKAVRVMVEHIDSRDDFSTAVRNDMKFYALVQALKNGNITLATENFMLRKDDNGEICDMLHATLPDVLWKKDDQREMFRRLSTKPRSIAVLVQLAGFYSFHFDVFLRFLQSLDSRIAILDHHMSTFYDCLEYGSYRPDMADTDCEIVDVNSTMEEVFTTQAEESKKCPLLSDLIKSSFPNHLTDVDVVNKLVEFATLFRREALVRSNERMDILLHVDVVERMLLECFRSTAMDNPNTQQKFLKEHNYMPSLVRHAHAFRDGPLTKCIDNMVSKVFNSGHVNSFVDTLYWGFLRQSNSDTLTDRPLLRSLRDVMYKILPVKKVSHRAENIIHLKTNFLYLRFSPACMYFLEGLAKLTFLGLIVRKTVFFDASPILNDVIYLFVVSLSLYELGELCDNTFVAFPSVSSAFNYFHSMWNRIDCIGFILVIAGIGLELVDNVYHRAAYALAVIFLSISMLNYFSAYEPIGHMVIMVFAMMQDLLKFAVIFIISIFGFCVAMYSLARHYPSGDFSTRTRTFLSMFNAAFANYPEFDEQFDEFGSQFRELSIAVEVTYIIFSAVVLLNLVIARMSATHDRLDRKALEEWQFTRATIVSSFLLLDERNPLSMIPPPFNLLPALFSVIEYPRILYMRWCMTSECEHSVSEYPVICITGTISDWFLGILISVTGPIIELVRYFFACILYEDFTTIAPELLGIVIFFPIIYPIYAATLLVETFSLRTLITLGTKDNGDPCYPIVYKELQHPKATSDECVFTARIVRLSGINPYLGSNHLPVVQIRLQNIIDYTGQCIVESSNAFVFSEATLTFPISQLDLSNAVDMTVSILDRDTLTGRDNIIASTIISDEKVKTWIANGRYEDRINLDNGRGSVQVVIKTVLPEKQINSWGSDPSTKRYLSKESSDAYSKLFRKTTRAERCDAIKRKTLFTDQERWKIFNTKGNEKSKERYLRAREREKVKSAVENERRRSRTVELSQGATSQEVVRVLSGTDDCKL